MNTALRSPEANTFRSLPSALETKIAALLQSLSLHTLHVDPTEVSNLPSSENIIVLEKWFPPPGRSNSIVLFKALRVAAL